ncbi:glycosyl hydrolase 53 family protein [Flammeovirga sp. OC4]|uniref:glycoside hydrolase family 53 protein n=1 Tax=Flammeovirga sp. OC4 TaxID=1382345 RepID=UPI0005C6F35F|nr:glycosyl hydrolase 53 family protein [Flammeovirga sp. OC4]
MTKSPLLLLLFIFLLFSCESSTSEQGPIEDKDEFIRGIDISRFPEIKNYNHQFYNNDGEEVEFLDHLKAKGVNAVRLRLWVNPANEHSGLDEVVAFSNELRSKGFKIWLTVHYSDTWADPGQQEKPKAWADLSFEELNTTVYQYTKDVVQKVQPDYIQIGNEINNGLLHPEGNLHSNETQCLTLLQSGIEATREVKSDTKIMLHFAGHEGADWFFDKMKSLNYDYIGLSYYPKWHGKSLTDLENTIKALSTKYQKEVLVAETAYPFTLEWNDWTNNIIGSDDQIIPSEYPSTEEGQKNFISKIRAISEQKRVTKGFCYWGGELIAWKGPEATDASPWENQAVFDFKNQALPVLDAFK